MLNKSISPKNLNVSSRKISYYKKLNLLPFVDKSQHLKMDILEAMIFLIIVNMFESRSNTKNLDLAIKQLYNRYDLFEVFNNIRHENGKGVLIYSDENNELLFYIEDLINLNYFNTYTYNIIPLKKIIQKIISVDLMNNNSDLHYLNYNENYILNLAKSKKYSCISINFNNKKQGVILDCNSAKLYDDLTNLFLDKKTPENSKILTNTINNQEIKLNIIT